MAISFVAAASATSRSSVIPVTVPATTQSGDRIIAILGTNSNAYTHVTPDGWGQLTTTYGLPGAGSSITTVYHKRAQSADAGATVEFLVNPGGAKNVAALAVYRADTSNLEISAFTQDGEYASGSTVVLPSVSVSSAPAHVVALAMRKAGTDGDSQELITWTPPASRDVRESPSDFGGGAISVVLADTAVAGTGPFAFGEFSTNKSSDIAAGISVALSEGEPPLLAQPVFRRWTETGWVPAP